MTLLSLVMSAVLVVLAAMHVLWALGVWFPLRDERALVAAAVGFRGATRMPGPIPCAMVAALLIVAAGLPWIAPGWLRSALMVAVALVFAGRGITAYLPFWRRMTPQEPFARLDQRFYAPLTLALALGFAVLAGG